MATALPTAQTPTGDAAIVYGKRSGNIKVAGADPSDAALAVVNANAATRETERESANAPGTAGAGGFAPDTADYFAKGSERG